MSEEVKTVNEETKVTVRFWAIVGMMVGALVWLSLTAFAHRERIVSLEATTLYMQKSAVEIKEVMTEIKRDLKEHIRETRNGRQR